MTPSENLIVKDVLDFFFIVRYHRQSVQVMNKLTPPQKLSIYKKVGATWESKWQSKKRSTSYNNLSLALSLFRFKRSCCSALYTYFLSLESNQRISLLFTVCVCVCSCCYMCYIITTFFPFSVGLGYKRGGNG